MASTSDLSIQKSFKYDVFLSFRGEDTRNSFVDHLYHALVNKGIITYKEYETIEKRRKISYDLIRSIEESKFQIIVFSKNYASSSWCLDELVHIMENQENKVQQTAYPIFYDVEPTDVRHQSGSVGEAFAKLVAKHENEEAVGKWRDALKQAGCLSGWELNNTYDGHGARFIQKVVEDISQKLHYINWRVDENLVGMETRVKNAVSSLETGFDDVRIIGIKGIGGAGKTTLARAIFYNESIWFEGKSFVENVKEVSKLSGLKELQKQVLSDVLNDQSIVVNSVSDGINMMKKMMPSRKVLVVLDDVDHIEQLKALAGEPCWFKPGSRIIITTRDEQVLIAHHVEFIHDVSPLSDEEAICLFNRYAFKRENSIEGYEELSRKVVSYADGLPLIVKVWGSHLCGRTEHEWVDAIERIKKIPLNRTLEKLELSYNGLQNDQKEIFLDVACLLKGFRKDKAIRLLDSCGFHAEIGLAVLQEKSLITISNDGRLLLHDHIEEMGKDIVRRVHPYEPAKHSRLWIREETENILVNDLGTEAIGCIKLSYTHLSPNIIMKGLRNMKKLRVLYVKNLKQQDVCAPPSSYDFASLLHIHSLQYISWHNYPLSFLPETFLANNIVNIEMPHSNISQLWDGREKKVLGKLKYLNLKYAKLRTFDLGTLQRLETLNLRGCNNLVELYMPVECPKLKFLDLGGSMLRNLDLRLTPHLEELHLEECHKLLELRMPIESPKLKFLGLRGSKLSNLKLGLTPYLEELDLEGCNDFLELHMPVESPKLKFLNLSGCKLSNLKLGLTPHLEKLDLEECNNFVKLHMPVELSKLKFLYLTGAKLSDFNLGLTPHLMRLESLQELTLSIKDMKHLPDSICTLKHLKSFELKSCFLLEQLPKDLGRLECLEKLHLSDCISLTDIPDSICNMKCLKCIQLPYCILVEKLPEELGCLECLEELNIVGTGINHLPRSIFELEDLCIVWSRGLLESHGFTSFTEISPYTASCYVKNKKTLTIGDSSKG